MADRTSPRGVFNIFQTVLKRKYATGVRRWFDKNNNSIADVDAKSLWIGRVFSGRFNDKRLSGYYYPPPALKERCIHLGKIYEITRDVIRETNQIGRSVRRGCRYQKKK